MADRTSIPKTIGKHRFFPVLLAAAHLSVGGVVIYLVDYHEKSEIRNMLYTWIHWNLEINFLMIAAGVLACRRDVAAAWLSLKNRTGLALAILLALAVLLIGFGAPRGHRIYYDEDIYLNVGQTMAEERQNAFANYATFNEDEYVVHWKSYNKEPSGWPYLASLVFRVFGTQEERAFDLNNGFYLGSILVIFFIVRRLTRRDFAALISAGVMATIPHQIIWCDTAAAEPAAAFLTGLAVLLVILYLQTGAARHLFLVAVLIPFGSQMRPESALGVLLILGILVATAPRRLFTRKLWSFALLTFLLFMPHLLHTYAVGGEEWGATAGTKFAWEYFVPNLKTNGIYYLSNDRFPVLFSLAALIGLAAGPLTAVWRVAAATWFLMFWGIFLFFYAGSYDYGADDRFALLSFMPLALTAGSGSVWLREKIAALVPDNRWLVGACLSLALFFNAGQLFPLVRKVGPEAWSARHDHQHAREFIEAIPERSIVLSQTPTMFLLWGRSAIQTYAGTNNRNEIEHLLDLYDGHVYFHEGYWCNTTAERQKRLCQAIHDAYHLIPVAAATERHHTYGLYRLQLEDPQGGPPPASR